MARGQSPRAVDVTTVDLARITAKDGREMAKLLQALQWPGFFYLDCRNEPTWQDVVEQCRGVYAVADEYFDQPVQEKMKDARENQPASSDRGYKSCETDESFEMSTDEMRQGSLRLPAPMAKQAQLLAGFHSHCHSAARELVARLADGLGVPLLESHGEDGPSESGLKLIAEPSVPRAADVVENKHRDGGTLTMLFYDEPSLQVCLSGDDDDDDDDERRQEWAFVPPPPRGCALVHGANSLGRLSGGRLRSPLHRVSQPSDGAAKRYFLSYFLRPEHRLRAGEGAAAVAAA